MDRLDNKETSFCIEGIPCGMVNHTEAFGMRIPSRKYLMPEEFTLKKLTNMDYYNYNHYSERYDAESSALRCYQMCPESCLKVIYETQIVDAKTDKHGRIISISMEVEHIESAPKYDVNTLIATYGGVLGLFTGFSFLTFVELLELLHDVTALMLHDVMGLLVRRVTSYMGCGGGVGGVVGVVRRRWAALAGWRGRGRTVQPHP